MSTSQEAPHPETPDTPQSPDDLLCTCCLEFKPPTEFRRRAKGQEQRVSQCRKCHNAEELHRRRIKRAQGQDLQMQKLASAIRQGRDTKRLQGLLAAGIAASGGYRGLLEKWYSTIQGDVESRKRPAQLVRFYQTLLKGLLRSDG